MKIRPTSKVRLEQQGDVFFDIWESTNYGFDIRLYPGLSYFALVKFSNEIDVQLLIYPDKSWFDEWLKELPKKPKIILACGKELKPRET